MTEDKSCVFRFGDIEVRENEFALTRSGEPVKVEPTAFRVLLYLLRNPRRLVTKDEIMAAVWHDIAVSDNSLTRSVATLRRVLDDSSREPRYIATVQTLGYRWLVPVEKYPADATPHSADAPSPERKEENRSPTTPLPAVAPHPTRRNLSALRLLVPACAGVIVALVLAGFYLISHGGSHPRAGSTYPTFARAAKAVVTVPGVVLYPALSPDGKQIAFTWRSQAEPRDDLYVQLIGAAQPLRLTHSSGGFICCAAWSPDGQQIAFGHCDDNGGGVYVIPALGGAERKITEVVCSQDDAGWPQWTPDGESLLLSDRCTPKGVRGIVVFSLVTGEKRCLTSPPSGGDYGDVAPALGVDHKTVAFFRTTTLLHQEVYIVDLSGQNLRQLTHGGYGLEPPLMWTADGKYVVFDSLAPDKRGPSRVSVQGGPFEPASAFPGVGSLSSDGRRLAYVDGNTSHSTWRVELASAGGNVRSIRNISVSSVGNEDTPELAPDGEHILVRLWPDDGTAEIWRTDADGQNPVQLTRTVRGWVGSPHWSPDGKWIVMDYRPENHSQIYMMDSEGRNFHPIIADQFENFVPRWSRDGRSIYFTSNRSGDWQLWKLDLGSGRMTRITDQGGISGFESYDGSTLYYAKRELGGLFRGSPSGWSEVRVTDALHVGYWGAFAVTENGIYFLDANAAPRPTVYYYDVRTGRSNPVLPFDRMPLHGAPMLTASRDGRRIIFNQGETVTHINLAEASP